MQQSKLSIVQVTDQLNVGGAEQVLVMLANLLQQHGHAVSVVTTVAPGPLAARLQQTIPVINLQRKWKWNPLVMYDLIKTLRNYDVVHVHSSYNLRYVFLASRLFRLRKPVFYHEHYGNAVNIQVDKLQRIILQKTCFIAVSKQLAGWAENVVQINPDCVFVLPNTVIAQSLSNTGKQGDVFSLCMVGNILPNKHILFGLKLMARLRNILQQKVSLTIIGNIADTAYYNQLKEYIQVHQLQHHVTFIHNCSDVQPLLHQFALALHTAISESGPLVLIEYMAQGLPFLTYRTGEVAEQVKDDVPQMIMNDFDEAKWVAAVQTLIHQPQQVLQWQLKKIYNQYFSPETYYQKCISIYKEGLQRKPLVVM